MNQLFLSISKPLVESSLHFLSIKYVTSIQAFKYLFLNTVFVGWGRKRSGKWSETMAKLFRKKFLLLEDGFIRSIGLGVEGSPSFSMVKDDTGIYYDATKSSKLEDILNDYDFDSDIHLMETAKKSKAKIIEYKISKYNNFKSVDLSYLEDARPKVLIIAQTAGDSSLEFGLGYHFTTQQMLDEAIQDNFEATIYIKIHPDVLCGKKQSDIDLKKIPSSIHILIDNINPIELMGYFDKIYTKTSGMGFEALLFGKEVHCYGMPFYAGWGVTEDKLLCDRRTKKLSVDEILAGAYILYSEYYNPYLNEKSDILSVIEYIAEDRKTNG